MLIDYNVLSEYGTTDAAIKKLFTCDDPSSDLHKKRKDWENRIESRIHEGALYNCNNYQFYAAADLAWDNNIITKELVPLMLYAQGKITFKSVEEQLRNLSVETREKFIKKDKEGKEYVDLPAFYKVVVSLTRSLLTKRVASIEARYVHQQPFMKFEPLGTSFVAQLRGDVLSQRIEMMANQYDYRHDLTQAVREMLMYSHTVEFPRSAWDRERSIRMKPGAEGQPAFKETYISREGLAYKRPHPTRTFFDMAYPLASLNTDTGCTYVGHWNVIPFREVQIGRAHV